MILSVLYRFQHIAMWQRVTIPCVMLVGMQLISCIQGAEPGTG